MTLFGTALFQFLPAPFSDWSHKVPHAPCQGFLRPGCTIIQHHHHPAQGGVERGRNWGTRAGGEVPLPRHVPPLLLPKSWNLDHDSGAIRASPHPAPSADILIRHNHSTMTVWGEHSRTQMYIRLAGRYTEQGWGMARTDTLHMLRDPFTKV